ncbi:MAG: hypothetical protein EOO20_27835 [Chryseobacterium sp.]|nr:MAG: hypothetical protein EOO20_27835 [Chryseobacterium sp.]
MKKSITVLSMLMMLAFQQCRHENIPASPKTENVQRSIADNYSGKVLRLLKTVEDQDPPRKDPWQWRDIIRRVWKFWRY